MNERFIALLRANYGQYWLPEFKRWDARTESLAAYCNSLCLSCSTDGQSWKSFLPGEATKTTRSAVALWNYSKPLSKEDWADLREACVAVPHDSLAAGVLVRAQRLLADGNVRYALIESVLALELAIDDLVRSRCGKDKALAGFFQAFFNLPLPTQLMAVGTGIAEEDLRDAIDAIKLRNRIVHEGLELTDENGWSQAGALLRAAGKLIAGPGFRTVETRPPSTRAGMGISIRFTRKEPLDGA